MEEIVRLAIVEVDGKAVEQPFVEFDIWNSKTRAFALSAWQALNATSKKELDAFLAGGELVDGDAFLDPSPHVGAQDGDYEEDGLE